MVFWKYTKGWNRDYSAAQKIYGHGQLGEIMRKALRLQNYMVYSNDYLNLDHKVYQIEGMESFSNILLECQPCDTLHDTGECNYIRSNRQVHQHQQQVGHDSTKLPHSSSSNASSSSSSSLSSSSARYIYVIMPDSHMRFSLMSKKLATDFLSKHVLHAGAAKEVVYSGEFFFDKCSTRSQETGQCAFIIDNNSGTFGPPKEKLDLYKLLMQLDFGRSSLCWLWIGMILCWVIWRRWIVLSDEMKMESKKWNIYIHIYNISCIVVLLFVTGIIASYLALVSFSGAWNK